ncbi:unnamed protein product [Anisakis simplex]|uniref:Uncharacterized protein n=1 Tax=Anisakis simplex TaxID=6269 RepID=A0A0M3KAU0_ANISI|nr:unnamed protein product [Anisakis simplex]
MGQQTPLQCSRCGKQMKLQKIDKNLPSNVMNYFVDQRDAIKAMLKSVSPYVQFQENQLKRLTKRFAETRVHNEQLRNCCMQMVKTKSELESQVALLHKARSVKNERKQAVTASTDSPMDVSTIPSEAVNYRSHQQKQLSTPSTLTDGSPNLSGTSHTLVPIAQRFDSSINSSVVSCGLVFFCKYDLKVRSLKTLRTASRIFQRCLSSYQYYPAGLRNENFKITAMDQMLNSNTNPSTQPSSATGQRNNSSTAAGRERDQIRSSTKLTQQPITNPPRKRDHYGNVSRCAKTAPVRKTPQEHNF